MKKSKKSIYVRYEFSNEAGRPEGGDVLKFSSLKDIQEMTADILKVAQTDNVTVNLTIGQEIPFFGFLKKVGMSRKTVEKEMIDLDAVMAPIQDLPAKQKAPTKKKAKSAKK